MEITKIEVVRRSPNAIEVAPGENLELTFGDILRITAGFNYRGPAQSITLYGAIGQRGTLSFDEIIHAEVSHNLPDSPFMFSEVTAVVDIPITADIAPKSGYDIYCKIKEYPEAGYPEVDDVITVVGLPPTFELLEEIIYPYAYIYDGDCEVSTFTFKSDPFTPSSWIAGRLAAKLEEEVKKSGVRIMEMRVYVDKSPLFWTDWQIEIVGTPAPATAGLGMPLGIAWWAVAILAVLVIIAIIVLTWSITTIASLFTHKGLDEEIKAAWSRETLISAINDFEIKLERTPTPTEELEAKTDQELRDYCDELAEAVSPGEGGIGLALVLVGAGILGIGALVAIGFSMRKRE